MRELHGLSEPQFHNTCSATVYKYNRALTFQHQDDLASTSVIEDNPDPFLECFKHRTSTAHANLNDRAIPWQPDLDCLCARAMTQLWKTYYQYDILPVPTSFRVLELLPVREGDPISRLLHYLNLSNPLEYEAISYAWGDANDKE